MQNIKNIFKDIKAITIQALIQAQKEKSKFDEE